MPDWYNIELRIEGSAVEIARFKRAAQGKLKVLDFHSLVPVPEHGGQASEEANWGCKWGACDCQLVEEADACLRYVFNTPSAPPVAFVTAASRQFPDLLFSMKVEEQHLDGYEEIVVKGGEVTLWRDGIAEYISFDKDELRRVSFADLEGDCRVNGHGEETTSFVAILRQWIRPKEAQELFESLVRVEGDRYIARTFDLTELDRLYDLCERRSLRWQRSIGLYWPIMVRRETLGRIALHLDVRKLAPLLWRLADPLDDAGPK